MTAYNDPLCARCKTDPVEIICCDEDDEYDFISSQCPQCNDRDAERYREYRDWNYWHCDDDQDHSGRVA